MNDGKLKQEKLKMWQAKLLELQKRYAEVVRLRGEAAQMGDLRENAAFQDADEESAVVSKRISDVEKIIAELEGPEAKVKNRSKNNYGHN